MSINAQPTREQIATVMARMEQLESLQLNFGINNTRITVDTLTVDLQENAPGFALSSTEVEAILRDSVLHGDVIEIERGIYRSKIAETTRDIRLVRQRFFDDNTGQPRKIARSPELVEAVRTEFRPRTRPNRLQATVEHLLDNGTAPIDDDIKQTLRWTIEEGLRWAGAAEFQRRAFTSIYELSNTGNAERKAIVVAGDTGSGKTEGFLFPILARIAQQKSDLARSGSAMHPGVGAVLVYPRIKLALNQLGRITRILKLWELYGGPRLTIGVQNTLVNSTIRQEHYDPLTKACERYGSMANIPARTVKMDLMDCPFEPPAAVLNQISQGGTATPDSSLVFEDNHAIKQANTTYPRLVSADPLYWQPQDPATTTPHQVVPNDGVLNQLLVTRRALQRSQLAPNSIPDILIITDKSLSRYLVQPEYQHLWGLWSEGNGPAIAPPQFLVLDEVHLMNGLNGAHLSRLISRFQQRTALAAQELGMGVRYAIPIGVSATLYDEASFMAKLLGMQPDDAHTKITVRKPNDKDSAGDELKTTTGRERYVFVRPREVSDPDTPEKRVGSMTAAVQIVMASMHNLMNRAQGTNFQYKGLAFFDSVNDVNLFEMFYNSQGGGRHGANVDKLWSIRTDYNCPLTGLRCKDASKGGAQKEYASANAFWLVIAGSSRKDGGGISRSRSVVPTTRAYRQLLSTCNATISYRRPPLWKSGTTMTPSNSFTSTWLPTTSLRSSSDGGARDATRSSRRSS